MKNSPRTITFLFCSLVCFALQAKNYVVNSPDGHLKARVSEQAGEHAFPMVDSHRNTASVCLSETDYPVVHICAQMLADDVERVTGRKPIVKEAASLNEIGKTPTIVVGTIGHSPLIDELIKQGCIDEINSMSISKPTMYYTLKEIDNKKDGDVARFVFEVLFGAPNKMFFEMIKDSVEPIYTLTESESGNIDYYGILFEKTPINNEITPNLGKD